VDIAAESVAIVHVASVGSVFASSDCLTMGKEK